MLKYGQACLWRRKDKNIHATLCCLRFKAICSQVSPPFVTMQAYDVEMTPTVVDATSSHRIYVNVRSFRSHIPAGKLQE